jgi:hypothetical protein
VRIKYGSIVEIDTTDEEFNAALALECECGHILSQHSWTEALWYPDKDHHTINPLTCIHCKCLYFKVKRDFV